MNTEDNTTEYQSFLDASIELTTAICAFEHLIDIINREDPYQPLMEVHCKAISAAHQSLLSRFSWRLEKAYEFLDKTSQNGSGFDFGPFQVISGDESVNPIKTV